MRQRSELPGSADFTSALLFYTGIRSIQPPAVSLTKKCYKMKLTTKKSRFFVIRFCFVDKIGQIMTKLIYFI